METTPQQNKKSDVEVFGGTVGIILVVILFVAGGIYFLYMQKQKIEMNKQLLQEQTNS
jgi:hypothetical protein